AAPEQEAVTGELRGGRVLASLRSVGGGADEPLEPRRVELRGVEAQHVPGGAGDEIVERRAAAPERLAELGDRVPRHPRRGVRRRVAPESLQELLGEHWLVRVQEEEN